MKDLEGLGVFYLGREYELDAAKPREDLLLYDAKDLTTHAVCVGMTGSGKTGLCLALLEEAAIDGIPALIIDPKGDLGNLLLTFPLLRPEDFEPWIDPAEAKRAGVSPAELAAKTAERWKSGLAEWGQEGERIQRFRDAVDIAIYTPGASAGLPLSVLRSFDVPPQSTLDDADTMRAKIGAAASGLLGLLGIDADPLRSREHILLANIFEKSWKAGQSLDMPGLIRAIQSPPLEKIGVVDLESFYPAKERFELAMQLNNLLASPGFSAWMEGEALDIQRLLYTSEGQPRVAILSIAHLPDAERMFFVTILLSEVISWMRSQPGTSSLRAILYMDEVFGYFPPSANPPSKTPMLTLLKQARAFGLGVVLATQNPVDLDYKGLANCGTWFLGRLQTERDKLRVLDGLEGASTAAGANFDRQTMERILSGLGNRVFLMNNVHEDQPVVFQTRWALSYLRGPLTTGEISRLMAERKATLTRSVSEGGAPGSRTRESSGVRGESGSLTTSATGTRPVLPPEITERFESRRADLPPGAKVLYQPALLGQAKVHYTQAASGVDVWEDAALLLPVSGALPPELWAAADGELDAPPDLEDQPETGASFAELPGELSRAKRYGELATALKDHLYRNRKLRLWKCPALKQTSAPGESEAEFRVRLGQLAREERDAKVEKLRQKYAPKLDSLKERRRKAQIRADKEKSQANQQAVSAALSFGSSIMGMLLGRKVASTANMTRAAGAMRAGSRAWQERQDIGDAEENVEAIDAKMSDLEAEFQAETTKVQDGLQPDKLALEELQIAPKKSEINVSGVTLVWQPTVG
jgi:hypothetical protein